MSLERRREQLRDARVQWVERALTTTDPRDHADIRDIIALLGAAMQAPPPKERRP